MRRIMSGVVAVSEETLQCARRPPGPYNGRGAERVRRDAGRPRSTACAERAEPQHARGGLSEFRDAVAVADVGRRDVQVGDQAEYLEEPQHVIREVDLPPEETLVGRPLVVVVIVVPPLTHREER